MNKRTLEELKKLEESIKRQEKVIKALDIYRDMVMPTEKEMREGGRWDYEDAN